ncbi:HAD family hydrolase [Robertmurraya massiliosenegalensis]|uniref:HAD family hydrolase n=1 Tax=Robertmurraya massiliosenegalensis TaxID=1287657 RepID=UPI00030C9765|nr:HAD family hydrolase [Robertmurraya massiliosenegalensis]
MNGIDKKAILFDKDGTLIEYNSIWPDATRAMIPRFRMQFDVQEEIDDEELLQRLGVGEDKVKDCTAIASGTSYDIAEVLKQALKNSDQDTLRFVREYFYQYTIENNKEIKAIGDVKTLFTRLKKADIRIGIVTADDYDSTLFALKQLKVDELVEFIATGDRYEAKPAMEAIEAFSVAIKIPRDQILFIGDSIIDMQFARHCRKGIAVLSGVGEEGELLQYTDAIYPTIHEIPYEQFLERKC